MGRTKFQRRTRVSLNSLFTTYKPSNSLLCLHPLRKFVLANRTCTMAQRVVVARAALTDSRQTRGTAREVVNNVAATRSSAPGRRPLLQLTRIVIGVGDERIRNGILRGRHPDRRPFDRHHPSLAPSSFRFPWPEDVCFVVSSLSVVVVVVVAVVVVA